MRLAITAWPASGDRVFPSDSYFGQVTIIPVMPACVGVAPIPALPAPKPDRRQGPWGDRSVPAKAFDNGWLNMS